MRVLVVRLRSALDGAPDQGDRGRWKWETGATACAAAALVTLIAGCSGVIGTAANGSEPAGPGGESGGLLGGGGGPPPSTFHPAPATLRRLTVAQYQNSVRDLLGGAITTPTDLEPDSQISGFASIAAARVAVSAHATEQFETAALALSHQALADTATRGSLVKCAPSGPTDGACASQFVTSFGLRAWRRPLTADEVSRYATIATTAGGVLKDFYSGLEYAVAGLLQSPHFLYREELGAPDPSDSSRRVFQSYELATRLSYFLWNTTPDDALLDAAAAGKLGTDAGLRAEAERLLASPRAHDATQSYFGELLHLADLDDLPQLPSVFPQMSATLGASMRSETLRVLDDVTMNGSNDFRQLFDMRSTFVNAELAKLYGLPAPGGTGLVKTTLPASGGRAGLLGQASFLALNAHAESSSPTRRGKFIREVLLCQSIPPPPPNVDTKLPADMAGGTQRTMRQKLEVHRQVATCATCHGVMDPIGLGLENFDGIGAYRTTDVGQTIDASGDLDGVTFQDARSLGTALRNHPSIGSCAARSIFRYATGHVEIDSEEVLIAALASKLSTDGYQFRSLLVALVSSAGFRYGGNLD
jgi:Protein of unknown function (DUF1592)/Protein of unknown function (DUF1588)/Protein of unknown function (DUF1595)/Protein of unknown function (DUF1587)/Protein of unknown function (DUF1585)